MTCSKCDLPVRSRGLCNRHYEAHRRRMLAYGKWNSQKVDAAPVRTHYEALLASGMSRNQVSRISGVKADQLDNLLRPRKDRGDQPARVVFRRTADRILAVTPPNHTQVWRTAAAVPMVDADDAVGVDEVAVDRGVAWIAGRVPRDRPEYAAWRAAQPPLSRSERIAVAHRCLDWTPRATLLAALRLRFSDLELEVAA